MDAPSPLQVSPPAASALSTTGGVVLTIAALYLGRDVFVPLALAILFSFVLTPPILLLRRWGMPRIPAVAVVSLLACMALGTIALAVGSQLVQLADDLPTHERNIRQKLASLRAAAPGSDLLDRVTGTMKSLSRELTKREEQAAPSTPAGKAAEPVRREPVPVVVEPVPMQPLESLQGILGPLMGPVGTAGLVLLFMIFILIEREELRDRFIKLVGGSDLQRSTEAINEAGTRVSRYLFMQLIVNVTYGIPIGVGLYLIGIPNAMLWGVFAIVLRFIPYLGPWIAALFPLAIGFGVDPGWSMLLWTVALFLVAELISNNVVEPWLYGSSTGLSSFAIVLAAIAWTLLWGPIGLFLATPMTVCLVVIGRYVPSLEFLGVALGSEPVLNPAERFYQRLLAGNVEEAVDLAEDSIKEIGSRAFFHDIAVPALRLAENDRQRGSDVDQRRKVTAAAIAVARDIAEESAEKTPRRPGSLTVLCIGGRTELDHAAAEILAARLTEIAIPTKTLAPMAVARGAIGQLELDGIGAVAVCYLDPKPDVYARYVFRRIERRAPQLSRIACCWNLASPSAAPELEARLAATVSVAASLPAAEDKIAEALDHPATGSLALPISDIDREEQDAMRTRGLTAGTGPDFDWIADETLAAFEVSLVQVLLADAACVVAPEGGDAEGKAPMALTGLVCRDVVAAGDIVAVENVAKDQRFAGNEELLEKGIQFFAAAPLRATSGVVIGVLCILGSQPRKFGKDERAKLSGLAETLMQRLRRPATSSVS